MKITGSLQIKNNRYYAVINLKDSNGKRIQKWHSTGYTVKGNKKRAEEVLNNLISEYNICNGCYEPTSTLFCDYIYDYVENIKYTIQKTTYDGYMHIIDKHIYPYFKALKITLSKLSTLDVENYYKSKLVENLSPNTIIKHHQLIHACLSNAVRLGTLKENVSDKAIKPKRRRTEASFYTSAELLELFKVVKNTSLELPVFFAVFYGLRRSEILGLKWSAIDFDKMTITINNKVVRCHNEKGSIIDIADSTLKSDTSYRVLPMNENICDYLSQFPQNNEYICTDNDGNRLKTDYITHKFRDIIIQHDFKPIRFHDLRHSCASLLILTGFNIKEVQEWLGHSDYAITANTYSHVSNLEKSGMINKLTEVLKNELYNQ